MIIDSHVHYNLSPLLENWQDHWQRAQQQGVSQSIIIGTNPQTSIQAVEQALNDDNLFASVGVHPNHWQQIAPVTTKDMAAHLTQLEQLLKAQKSKIVAIGETGLDYFRQNKNHLQFFTVKDLQQQSLAQHLALATQYQLPLILHVRDQVAPELPEENNAYWDTLKIVEEHLENHHLYGIVLHCVSGPRAYIKAMLELGAYIGVAGNLTYKSADHIRKIVQMTPTKRLMLETDAPYLPPEPHRGTTCEPWMITETARFLLVEKKLEQTHLMNNTAHFFNL